MSAGGVFSFSANNSYGDIFGQIVDREKTDQRDSFLYNPCAPVLLFSIHDHERLIYHQACLAGGGNRLQEGSTAGQHIVYDQRVISRAHCSFNQLPQSMVFRLLTYDKSPPIPSRSGSIAIVRDSRGNRDCADFKASKAVDLHLCQGIMRELSHEPARPGIGHQRSTIDIEGALLTGRKYKLLNGVPLERLRIVKCASKIVSYCHG